MTTRHRFVVAIVTFGIIALLVVFWPVPGNTEATIAPRVTEGCENPSERTEFSRLIFVGSNRQTVAIGLVFQNNLGVASPPSAGNPYAFAKEVIYQAYDRGEIRSLDNLQKMAEEAVNRFVHSGDDPAFTVCVEYRGEQ